MAQTYTIDDVPATLAAWDRALPTRDRMLSLARRQREEDEAHEASLEQKAQWIRDDLTKLLAKEGLEASVFFLPRSKPVRADKVHEVLGEMFDEAPEFRKKLLQLCWHASNGMDCKELACAILAGMVEKVADVYKEEVL